MHVTISLIFAGGKKKLVRVERFKGALGVNAVSTTGAPLVKALPVNPTDPSVTGPDIFAKLVPMAAHEASSLYRFD